MKHIASKTFASQFMSMGESNVSTNFERMTVAIKNGKVELLHSIAFKDEQVKQKDQLQKNLLFYAVYDKQPSALLYLLMRGVPHNQIDKQHKNLYHFCAYSGSYQCLEVLSVYKKIEKLKKISQLFLELLHKYNYKRTDAKNGQLKYSVSPKRQQAFLELQKQITALVTEYLMTHIADIFDSLKQKQQNQERNPLHLVCLNKYQKCFTTLEGIFYHFQNPDVQLSEKMLSEFQAINKIIINNPLDPRLYTNVFENLKDFMNQRELNRLQFEYQKQLKSGIKSILSDRDSSDQTPLCIASINGSTSMINFLKKYAPNTKQQQKKQIMKVACHNLARSHIIDLCQASKLPDTKPLNFLLSCGEKVNEKKTIFGTFALLEAFKGFKNQKSLQPVKILLKNGANVNAQDTNGWTLLHHAANSGQKPIIQLLYEEKLKNNFDLNKLTNNRYHALHLAAMSNKPDVIKYLIETCAINIEFKDGDGCTALHHACKKGSFEAMKQLLILKANLYACDIMMMNPLHHAGSSNNIKCIKELIKYDADQNKLQDMKNSKGKKPKDLSSESKHFYNIYQASRIGNINVIRKLTAENLNLKDQPTIEKNRTPLIISVIAQALTSVKFLLQLGVDTYHEDIDQKSASQYAIQAFNKAKLEKNKQKILIAAQIKQLLDGQ